MTKKEMPYETIAKYIRQECTDSERQKMEQWINASEENKNVFENLLHEWQYIYNTNEFVFPDKENIWSNIIQKIQKPLDVPHLYTKQFLLRICSLAAAITLIIGITTTLLVKSKVDTTLLSESMTTVETQQGQKMQMTLPDGTQVWLNSGSKLSYTGNFNKSEREVYLDGEAFFDVTKNEAKRFVVNASDIKVVVKGTAFDVSAYADDKDINISLLRGSVSITSQSGKHLTDMASNELAIVSRKDLQYSLYKSDAETYHTWIKNELNIYNADIHEVSKKLERWYGINIQLQNANEKQKYTFSVKTESLRELLDLFNKITPIDYDIEGKEVAINCK